MAKIDVNKIGQRGVIVDLNPNEADENAFLALKNLIASGIFSIRKRPGLIAFTTSATAGTVLGGADLPVADQHSAEHFIFIGRCTP